MSWKIKFHILLTGLTLALLMYLDQRGEALEPKVRVAQAESSKKVEARASSDTKPKEPHFMGVASCSAVACHGGDGPSNALTYEPGSEYSTWVQNDPHAQAFTVLKNDVSVKMAKALNLQKAAHESPLCLNCHGPQQSTPINDLALVNQERIEGVSCEACHGNAEKWLISHRRSDWKAGKTPQEVWNEYGFRDTKDPWTRAQVCASCHVGGAGGKDVNHDLYAAGHPRLFFELSAFNANLPAHWNRNNDRKRESDDDGRTSSYEAKLWAVGQVAGVHAAVELAEYRAAQSQKPFVWPAKYPAGSTIPAWPEFAETGCFACHHDLKAPSWRQMRGFAKRTPGGFPWQSWLTPLVGDAAGIGGANVAELENDLGRFARLMSDSRPDEKQVASQAKSLKAVLANIGQRLSDSNQRITAGQVNTVLSHMLSDTERVRHVKENWDSATQLYLAVVALRESSRDIDGRFGQDPPPAMTTALETIRRQLEFLPNSDSPKNYSTFDKNKDTQLILEQLESIANQIK